MGYFRGRIVGAESSIGHRLRENDSISPSRVERAGVVIVGSGMAGLNAAWRLKKKGVTDFRVLELSSSYGGNSRSGENEVSKYPWGAHYVPIPTEESVHVRELFEELGVITGHDDQGQPIFNELYVCEAPLERLSIGGTWQEGLIPRLGLSEEEEKSIEAFFQLMAEYRKKKGSDGRKFFAIPIDASSRDPEARELDRISFKEFLEARGLRSKPLNWYVDYCCRDDFGTRFDEVSAWAGIHYFAARGGRSSNTESNALLTWPEGNGWLVQELIERIGKERLQSDALVRSVSQTKTGVLVDYLDVKTGERVRIEADRVIYSGPRFTAAHVVEGLRERPQEVTEGFEYAPWLVANVTIKGSVPAARGFPLAWDNVRYEGKSLGYVVANHQDLRRYDAANVLTFFWPLSDEDPKAVRTRALAKTHGEWCSEVVGELEAMHPHISEQIENIDVCVWAHAMIRPRPGFIWGPERMAARKPLGRIHFAHSDLSSISIFEEAQIQGIRAADEVIMARQRIAPHA